MRVKLIEKSTGKSIDGEIRKIGIKDLLQNKSKWQFNWFELFENNTDANLYCVISLDEPSEIQAIMMFSIQHGEVPYMNAIETSPWNYGSDGKYNAVGCLLAFACLLAHREGVGNYKGFLSFTSKTKLIGLYRDKYGASKALGQRIFFTLEAGKNLIDKYLNTIK